MGEFIVTDIIGEVYADIGLDAEIMRISVTTSNKNGENEVHSGFKLPRFSSAQKLAQSLRGLADHIEKRQD